jgi:hypothetical protein
MPWIPNQTHNNRPNWPMSEVSVINCLESLHARRRPRMKIVAHDITSHTQHSISSNKESFHLILSNQTTVFCNSSAHKANAFHRTAHRVEAAGGMALRLARNAVLVLSWASVAKQNVFDVVYGMGMSMSPTIPDGSFIVVDRLSRRWRAFQRDDLVLLRSPTRRHGETICKRILALVRVCIAAFCSCGGRLTWHVRTTGGRRGGAAAALRRLAAGYRGRAKGPRVGGGR